MNLRERIDHMKQPAVDGGPFAGTPRWLFLAMLGGASIAWLAFELGR